MKSQTNPAAEIVTHFQISASTKPGLEFLHTHRPEELQKTKEHFELKTYCNLLNHSIHAGDKLVVSRNVWLVEHVFQSFGLLQMVF